jgi:hypothetical protein
MICVTEWIKTCLIRPKHRKHGRVGLEQDPRVRSLSCVLHVRRGQHGGKRSADRLAPLNLRYGCRTTTCGHPMQRRIKLHYNISIATLYTFVPLVSPPIKQISVLESKPPIVSYVCGGISRPTETSCDSSQRVQHDIKMPVALNLSKKSPEVISAAHHSFTHSFSRTQG